MSIPDLDPLLPLPDNILRLARADPNRQLGYIINEPSASNAEHTLNSLTWRQALVDIRRRADELVKACGRPARNPGEDKFVVGLLLRNGYGYFVTLTAVIMLRWTPLVLSPRNSPSGTIHIMQTAQSKHLIVDSDLLAYAENLNEPSFQIVKTAITTAPAAIGSEHTGDVWPNYPTATSEALAEEARTGVMTYMHTSGSTGHPKTVPWNHKWFLTIMAAVRSQRPESVNCIWYTVMPLFHSIGLLLTYVFSVGLAARIHFVDLRRPPTPTGILKHLALHGKESMHMMLPPSILEDLMDGELREEGLKYLKRAAVLLTGGAPLRHDVGDLLGESGVPLQNLMGMTEVGMLTAIMTPKDPKDWKYMILTPLYQFYFKPIDSEGSAREMIVLPKDNTPCLINHDNPRGFSTSDLWQQHPDPAKSHLWTVAGRIDDVTVLSNGEKTNNKQLETLLCTSPLISNAAIFGAGRFLNGAVICPPEPLPADDPAAAEAYLDSVWPHITEKVNAIIPGHSCLIRPLVLVAAPNKPFVLTDKRSLNRKVTLKLYTDEIEAAYVRVDEGEYEEVELPEKGLAHDEESVNKYISEVVKKILQRPVPLDDDLFDAGLDSLLAMRIRTSLMAALRKSGKTVTVSRNIVYTLPTPRGLAKYLRDALSSDKVVDENDPAAIEAAITAAIAEYTTNFPKHQPASGAKKPEGDVYALTGTTGSLGSFFVPFLLSRPEVRKIYLLNRKTDAGTIEERYKASFREKALDYEVLERAVKAGRVVHLEVSLGQTNLGLKQADYDKLRTEVTQIVHSAWLLNFNLILPSFKTHIQGMRNLIDLALSSSLPSPPHLTFLSSVAVVAGCRGSAPEAAMPNPSTCLPQGYAHSKYVAEKVLQTAVEQRPGFKATIIRSGQIAGAEGTGAWSRQEHVSILLRSCVEFGMVPEDLPPVRWLPVNVGAQVVYMEIQAAQASSEPLTFFNLETSTTTPWDMVAKTVSKVYKLPLVPASQWLEQVRRRTDSPANKLLTFFEEYVGGQEALPPLELTNARAAAGSRVDYKADEELVAAYARYAASGR